MVAPEATKSCGTFNLVQVLADGDVVLRPERVEDREDLVLLDELPRDLDRLRRVVGVVEDLVLDPALADAAGGVDEVEVRLRAARDRRVGGGRAGERRCPSDEDRRRRDAGIGGAAGERRPGNDEGDDAPAAAPEGGLSSHHSERE